MKPLTAYNRYKREAPKWPPYLCPKLDTVVEEAEELRTAIEDLREAGCYWKDSCKELSEEIYELKLDIRELKKKKK